nr:MAG TPA: hypothetical protein [Caudoviricetes sp.]
MKSPKYKEIKEVIKSKCNFLYNGIKILKYALCFELTLDN